MPVTDGEGDSPDSGNILAASDRMNGAGPTETKSRTVDNEAERVAFRWIILSVDLL
jgi:hypothetical protein